MSSSVTFEQRHAEAATRPITPTGTVPPGRKSGHEERDDDDEKNSETNDMAFRSLSRGLPVRRAGRASSARAWRCCRHVYW